MLRVIPKFSSSKRYQVIEAVIIAECDTCHIKIEHHMEGSGAVGKIKALIRSLGWQIKNYQTCYCPDHRVSSWYDKKKAESKRSRPWSWS